MNHSLPEIHLWHVVHRHEAPQSLSQPTDRGSAHGGAVGPAAGRLWKIGGSNKNDGYMWVKSTNSFSKRIIQVNISKKSSQKWGVGWSRSKESLCLKKRQQKGGNSRYANWFFRSVSGITYEMGLWRFQDWWSAGRSTNFVWKSPDHRQFCRLHCIKDGTKPFFPTC